MFILSIGILLSWFAQGMWAPASFWLAGFFAVFFPFMARSWQPVCLPVLARFEETGVLQSHGSLFYSGVLFHGGSLIHGGVLLCHGSLFLVGCLYDIGSLKRSGFLAINGSLPLPGVLL